MNLDGWYINNLVAKIHSHDVDLLEKHFFRINIKATDDILHFSYQYNLKIVGVARINENESA